MVIKNDNRPRSPNKAITRGVVGYPQLHVGGIGGVTDIERVKQNRSGDITRLHLGLHTLQTARTHDVHIRRTKPHLTPFRQRRFAGA